LAPFSCYTFVSTVPPLIAISCGRKFGVVKDTVSNAVRSGEFVVNVASHDMLDALHHSSAELAADTSEAEALGIELAASHALAAPRVARAQISMECRTRDVIEFGTHRTQLLIGEVVWFHVKDECLRGGRIDTALLDPIGRVGGPNYARLGAIEGKEPVATSSVDAARNRRP
jgi:flavin reductase (DIM6/NTAB) family NADH-FMN oxidoreductase RutF